MFANVSGVSRDTDHGVQHVCNSLTISPKLETRTKESKHARRFLVSLACLEVTTGGVSAGGRAHSYPSIRCCVDQGGPARVYKFFFSREA